MDNIELAADFHNWTDIWKRYFKYIGLDLNRRHETKLIALLKAAAIASNVIYIIGLILYFLYSDADGNEKARSISSTSYCSAALGRLLTAVRGKYELMSCIEKFRKIFPDKHCIRRYNLGRYFQLYRRFELYLYYFIHGLVFLSWSGPILVGIAALFFKNIKFKLALPFEFYNSFMVYESWYIFSIVYILEVFMDYGIAFPIFANDVCLISLLTQLSMHFDLIAKRIGKIDASKENAEQLLTKYICCHREVLKLSNDVNRIFTPSLTLCLLSSCFILCLNGLNLLDEMPMNYIIIALTILLYEFKQVVIKCYFGEKLMQNSERLFTELYNHNWYEGSIRYKKMVLMAMCRMRHPSALTVGKISKLNLTTVKVVLSNTYQAFTVLKTTKGRA